MRTIESDLAEERRSAISDLTRIDLQKEVRQGIQSTVLKIKDPADACLLGKPIGTYITLQHPDFLSEEANEEQWIDVLSRILLQESLRILHRTRIEGICVLILGIGNRAITVDSVGPKTADRCLPSAFDVPSEADGAKNRIAVFAPGVHAQSGMEIADFAKAIAKELSPDLILTVDALVAHAAERLGCTIQISDSGVIPGEGIGEKRSAISAESMGVPVLSVGVPTVVRASSLLHDAFFYAESAGVLLPAALKEDIVKGAALQYVTAKDCDLFVERASYVLSSAIHRVFQLGLSLRVQ